MRHCTHTRGFTLIELVITVLIIAILAAAAVSYERSALANANLSSATNDLALQLGGLRASAMRDGQDYLLVIVDAPGSDGSGCNGTAAKCATAWTLKNPQPGWTLNGFDPASPGANADVVEYTTLPRRVHFDLGSTAAPPAPFDTVHAFDAELKGSCSGRACLAFRYTGLGNVGPVYAGASTTRKVGATLALTSQLDGSTDAVDRRVVFVSFPTAIVRNAGY